MKYDALTVVEVILEELARALGLGAGAVERCRVMLADLLKPRRSVLFLAAGDRPPGDAAVQAFRALVALGVDPSLVRSHSFSQVWSERMVGERLGAVRLLDGLDSAAIARLPDRFPLLCVLTLSPNAVAKTVLGLHDAVPPRLLRAFLDRGKPVVAAGSPPHRMDLDESAGLFWNLPAPMRQWMFEGYRTLQQWGVEFVEPEILPRVVRARLFGRSEPGSAEGPAASPSGRSGRVFITVDDVRAARHRGERRIEAPPNAIVTEEAREFAARWGVFLVEGEK